MSTYEGNIREAIELQAKAAAWDILVNLVQEEIDVTTRGFIENSDTLSAARYRGEISKLIEVKSYMSETLRDCLIQAGHTLVSIAEAIPAQSISLVDLEEDPEIQDC